MKGHLAHRSLCVLSPKVTFQGQVEKENQVELPDPGSPGKRTLRPRWCGLASRGYLARKNTASATTDADPKNDCKQLRVCVCSNSLPVDTHRCLYWLG